MSKTSYCAAYNNSIDPTSSEAAYKKEELLQKLKLNNSKLEAVAEKGAKKIFLSVFTDTHTSKLKYPIKYHIGVLYY